MKTYQTNEIKNIVLIGAPGFLFSSAGTNPRPFSMVKSMLKRTEGSVVQMTSSGLRI